MEYNVIIYNFNLQKMEYYNIIPYFVNCYKQLLIKPNTFKEFKEFILSQARYHFWSRCEFEIIISDWPNKKIEEKWDVYNQIEMNIDCITELFIKCIKK